MCVLGAYAAEPQIGKSMGRWTGFGLESMKANKAAGLDYIEITMNNVIGKNPQELFAARDILLGNAPQPDNSRIDSLAFAVNAAFFDMKGTRYP